MTESYQGWKNWETWDVYSWLSNDEDVQPNLVRQAMDLLERYEDEDTAASVLGEALELTVSETKNPLADDASLYHDLLREALRVVDWEEIAHHFVGEAILELHPEEGLDEEEWSDWVEGVEA